MKFIALIGLLLCSILQTPAHAYYESNTTIYEVLKAGSDLMIVKVDKATLKETTCKLPFKKHAAHGTYLFSDDDQTMYLTSESEKDLVVFNHRTGRTIKRIKFENNIRCFAIHGSYGYALLAGSSRTPNNHLQLIDLRTYAITHLESPVAENLDTYKHEEFFIHKGTGYHLLTGHTKLYTFNLATNTYEPNPLEFNQPHSYRCHFGDYACFDQLSIGPSQLHFWNLQTKTLVHSFDSKGGTLELLGLFKNKLFYSYQQTDDILIYDFETKQTSTIPFKLAQCFNGVTIGRDKFMYRIIGDPETRKYFLRLINMDEETVDPTFVELRSFDQKQFDIDVFHRHFYDGFTKLIPLLPTKQELIGPNLAVLLADFKAYNPEPFQLGRVKKHHASLTANLFDTLAVYTLFDDVFSKLSPLDCLNTLLTLQNPKNRLESVPGRKFLKEVVYKELFLNLFKKDNATAAAMIKCLVQLEDPLVTPLATFETYSAEPLADQSSDPDRRVRRRLEA